jgi:hypothetical protein
MSSAPACPARGLPFLLSTALLVLPASGCGDSSGVGRTVPVSGKVLLDNAPWTATTTIVLFKPDGSRGNTSPFEPTGTVNSEGIYTLTTRGKNGAPPGWYRAVVTARGEAPPAHPNNPGPHRPVAQSLLPARYGLAETSGLSIEVVENPDPGAYDLKLTQEAGSKPAPE